MAELKEYVSQQEDLGAIHISQDVIASIAAMAASEVEGVASLAGGRSAVGSKVPLRGVRLQITEESVEVSISLSVASTAAVRAVAEKVQDAVISSVKDMTGLTVDRVNVHVVGISLD